MSISDRLKNNRKQADLTQEEIDQKLHVSRQTISSWKNSKSLPYVTSLNLLSDVYKILY